VIYTDPSLEPGGAGPPPGPPEQQPAVSAYTGLNGDVPPPYGYANVGLPPMAPGIYSPTPSAPSPALWPGSPMPGPPVAGPQAPENLPDMLMPAPPPPPAASAQVSGQAAVGQPASAPDDGTAPPVNAPSQPPPGEGTPSS
jgi:phospholipid/cholesterol/gamma-HCH transport system substrate-binding protein